MNRRTDAGRHEPAEVNLPTGLLRGLPPVVAPHTRLVVLGSFPGVQSLRTQQYYGHPRNHFWPILSALWSVDLSARPYPDRIAFIRERGLGLWDVYASCRREGSLDSAIEAAEPNELTALLEWAPGLQGIAHNGGESARAMRVTQALGPPVWRLPSTSPANASWRFERKLAAWRQCFEAVGLLDARPDRVAEDTPGDPPLDGAANGRARRVDNRPP